ncbi:MAG: hypothetical protein IK133_04675 [Clostridia bacterium]|nr:hypothetical protein [Clostridia bacterium]MBR5383097.1 hypothetical protein [Clostridia bacterium]
MDQAIMRTLFHNILYVDEVNGYLVPRRYTPEQRAFYDTIAYATIMGSKARCSAGVTLEFDTDAENITLFWQILDGYPMNTRERGSTIDVYIDGVLRWQHFITCPFHSAQETSIPLGAGSKRVVIWLPHTYDFALRDITLPQGAVLTPVPQRKRRILMLGDSITQGIGAAYASTGYAMQAAAAFDCEALNQSVAAVRFEPDCLADIGFMPDLITVALGANDWSNRKDKADFDLYAAGFFARLNELFPQSPVLVLSPVKRCRQEPDQPPFRPDLYRESKLFEALTALCAPYPQMRCIDGWRLMPHTRGFFLDGLHPNDLGMTLYAQALLPYMYDAIK